MKFLFYSFANMSRAEELEQIATRSTQMIEVLSEENRSLREELNVNYKKVSKLQKVGFQIINPNLFLSSYKSFSIIIFARINIDSLLHFK